MSNKAALILVYNHRYDNNVPILEEIYRGRFSAVYHLVPFYDGRQQNVIAVFENSYQFQGYLAQGLRHYFQEEIDHYVFAADDLLLHPAINENNLGEWFGLNPDSGFIPHVFNIYQLDNQQTLYFQEYTKKGKKRFFWWRLRDLAKYRHQVEGLENGKEMPTFAEAERLLRAHGFSIRPLRFVDLYGPPSLRHGNQTFVERAWAYAKALRHYRRKYPLNYPAVAAFSDIAIVPKASVRKFAHYCGVFAANGLFVEFALPTALALSTEKIVTESSIERKGTVYWSYNEQDANKYEEAMRPYQRDLRRLLRNFPANQLYIHPVKLSQWKI